MWLFHNNRHTHRQTKTGLSTNTDICRVLKRDSKRMNVWKREREMESADISYAYDMSFVAGKNNQRSHWQSYSNRQTDIQLHTAKQAFIFTFIFTLTFTFTLTSLLHSWTHPFTIIYYVIVLMNSNWITVSTWICVVDAIITYFICHLLREYRYR